MKEAFPDSLFVVTGDHSNLFGSLNNTSLIQRDYTLRDTFCTVGSNYNTLLSLGYDYGANWHAYEPHAYHY